MVGNLLTSNFEKLTYNRIKTEFPCHSFKRGGKYFSLQKLISIFENVKANFCFKLFKLSTGMISLFFS